MVPLLSDFLSRFEISNPNEMLDNGSPLFKPASGESRVQPKQETAHAPVKFHGINRTLAVRATPAQEGSRQGILAPGVPSASHLSISGLGVSTC